MFLVCAWGLLERGKLSHYSENFLGAVSAPTFIFHYYTEIKLSKMEFTEDYDLLRGECGHIRWDKLTLNRLHEFFSYI